MSTYNEYIFIKIWNDGDILNNELEMVIVQIITVLTVVQYNCTNI